VVFCRHENQVARPGAGAHRELAADAQDQLADIALDIDAALKDVVYEPTDAELAGIDRGLRDAAEGRFATDAEVEAAFAKFRSAASPSS
jgi:predicted transcriptional regulator